MSARPAPSGFHPVRRDHLLQEREHDAYQLKGKLPEPSVCSSCGATFHDGRWQWGVAPAAAQHVTCPACHRIRDRFPAGFVTFDGDFLKAHRDEIEHLVRNEEQHQRVEHPLKRIMDMEATENELRITTTDIHLARSIGEAVHRAYQGELDFHYNPEQILLRVHWTR